MISLMEEITQIHDTANSGNTIYDYKMSRDSYHKLMLHQILGTVFMVEK